MGLVAAPALRPCRRVECGIFVFKGRRPASFAASQRQVIRDLPGSKIREVANAAIGRSDVLPFWFGQSDEATPAHIREAAVRSIGEGETFYSHNLGLAELREALAHYVSALHRPLDAGRLAVTSSGVNALMLAMQAWSAPATRSSRSRRSGPTHRPAGDPRRPGGAAAGGRSAWGSISSAAPCRDFGHRVPLVNSPNSPTGWTPPVSSSRRCSTTAGRPAPGSCRRDHEPFAGRPAPARRASWTSPSPTIASWWCTASRRAS